MADVRATFTINDNDVLSDGQWDEIANIIAENGTEGLKTEVLDQAMVNLKMDAQNFLNVYETNLPKLTNLRNILNERKRIRNSTSAVQVEKIARVYDQQKIEIDEILNEVSPAIYNAVFTFQEHLNNFLGQQTKTIIVYQGELYEADTDQYMNLLKNGYDRGTLRAHYNVTQDTLNTALHKLNFEDTYNTREIDRVKYGENSALWRYNYSRQVRKGVAIVMWRNPDDMSQWNGMSVSARGDIEEAYATILLTHQESKFTSDVIERILETFMKDFVANVDNTSGMLEGDVSIDNIEYAIKAADASVLGYRQFGAVANMVLSDDFSQDKLVAYQRELHEKGKPRNKFYQDMNDEVLQNLIDAHEKALYEGALT